MKEFYLDWLGPDSGMKKKLQILRNLLFHFSEDEARWKEQHTDNEGVYFTSSSYLLHMYIHVGIYVCMYKPVVNALIAYRENVRTYVCCVEWLSGSHHIHTHPIILVLLYFTTDTQGEDSEALADLGDQLSL